MQFWFLFFAYFLHMHLLSKQFWFTFLDPYNAHIAFDSQTFLRKPNSFTISVSLIFRRYKIHQELLVEYFYLGSFGLVFFFSFLVGSSNWSWIELNYLSLVWILNFSLNSSLLNLVISSLTGGYIDRKMSKLLFILSLIFFKKRSINVFSFMT